MFEKLLEWDTETLLFINNLGSPQFDAFWLITTSFMTWIPLFLFILLLFFMMHSRKEAMWMVLSYISMLVVLSIVIFSFKNGIGRLRPVNDTEINTFLRIITKPSDFSFISGHAASSFSIATLAFLYLRKKVKRSYLLFIWPILFSFSRMYLGVHFPLDIIAGMFVGVFFAMIFYRMHSKIIAPYIL